MIRYSLDKLTQTKDLISSHCASILQKWKSTMNKMRAVAGLSIYILREKPSFLKNNPKKPQKINFEEFHRIFVILFLCVCMTVQVGVY